MTDKIAMNVPIAAPPATGFQALTDAGELEQWFAERAAVSCEKKTYNFWGRFTPGAPSEAGGAASSSRLRERREAQFRVAASG